MGLRVTDNYASRLSVRALQHNLSELLRFQQMNSTMRRINSYADDPRGVGAVQRYDTLLSLNDQYLKNLGRARTFIQATDSALTNVVDVIRGARDIALRETSATGTPTSNDQSADEIGTLIGQVTSILNASVEGNFVFGGFRTDLAPFLDVGGEVQYQGDAGEILTQIGPHSQVPVNVPGSAVMGSAKAMLSGSADVAPPLTLTSALTGLNLGRGWQPGSIVIADGNGQSWSIDLSAAADVQDVVDAVAARSGGALTAGIAPDGQGLQITGVGPLTVSEANQGTTAQSLGLRGGATDGVLIGADVRGAPQATTPLADLPGLGGALPLGSIIIRRGGTATTIDLSGAVTVGDLAAAISAAVPGMTLEYADGIFSLVNSDASAFEVTSATGSTAAGALGLQGTGTPARLFGVFEDLRDALRAHDKPAIRALFAELSAVEDTVLGLVVKVGGRETMLDWMDTVLQQRDTQLQTDRASERDADLIETASDLSRAQAAYQASLLASSRMFTENLMSYLK